MALFHLIWTFGMISNRFDQWSTLFTVYCIADTTVFKKQFQMNKSSSEIHENHKLAESRSYLNVFKISTGIIPVLCEGTSEHMAVYWIRWYCLLATCIPFINVLTA